MANQLGMDKVQAIFALHEVGWSNRRIARELGIHRTTVAGYLDTRGDSKPTKVPAGSSRETQPQKTPQKRKQTTPARRSHAVTQRHDLPSTGKNGYITLNIRMAVSFEVPTRSILNVPGNFAGWFRPRATHIRP